MIFLSFSLVNTTLNGATKQYWPRSDGMVSGGIWMVWRNSGGICERKIMFRMKKEADQTGFKGTQTGPLSRQREWHNKVFHVENAV